MGEKDLNTTPRQPDSSSISEQVNLEFDDKQLEYAYILYLGRKYQRVSNIVIGTMGTWSVVSAARLLLFGLNLRRGFTISVCCFVATADLWIVRHLSTPRGLLSSEYFRAWAYVINTMEAMVLVIMTKHVEVPLFDFPVFHSTLSHVMNTLFHFRNITSYRLAVVSFVCSICTEVACCLCGQWAPARFTLEILVTLGVWLAIQFNCRRDAVERKHFLAIFQPQRWRYQSHAGSRPSLSAAAG